MSYFDAHLHVMPDDVLMRAREKGVETFFMNGTHEDDWESVLSISQRILGVYPCFGIHPWFIETASPFWQARLEKLLQQYPMAMIGEIGLDMNRPDYLRQKEIFYQQMQLAVAYNRPVHIHCVKAWDDMLEILNELKEVQFLLHRFSGDEIIVQKIRFLNGFFSVLNKKVLDVIPDNRVLVESDAPDGLHTPEAIPDLVVRLGLQPDYLKQNLELFLSGR